MQKDRVLVVELPKAKTPQEEEYFLKFDFKQRKISLGEKESPFFDDSDKKSFPLNYYFGIVNEMNSGQLNIIIEKEHL
jgi:hypothetical protein